VFEDLALEMLQTEPELKAKFEAWKAANPALLSTRKRCWASSSPTASARRTGMAPLSRARPDVNQVSDCNMRRRIGDPGAARMQAAHKAIAMHYALNLRTFFIAITFTLACASRRPGRRDLITLQFADMATAMTVCIGALCTALMDMPSPLRHKFNEMSASVLLCSAVTLLISLCAPSLAADDHAGARQLSPA
jgi:hypothetical protein